MDPCLSRVLKTFFSLIDPETQELNEPTPEFFALCASQIKAVFNSPLISMSANSLKCSAFVAHSEESLLQARAELMADTTVHVQMGPLVDSLAIKAVEEAEPKRKVDPNEDLVIQSVGLFAARLPPKDYRPPTAPPKVMQTPSGVSVHAAFVTKANLVVVRNSLHVRSVSFTDRNFGVKLLVRSAGVKIYCTSDQVFFDGASIVAAEEFADLVFADRAFEQLSIEQVNIEDFIKRSVEGKKEILAKMMSGQASKFDQSNLATIALAISCLRVCGKLERPDSIFQLAELPKVGLSETLSRELTPTTHDIIESGNGHDREDIRRNEA